MEQLSHEVQKRTGRQSPDQRALDIEAVSWHGLCYLAGAAGIRSIIIFIMLCIISMRFSIIG